MTKPTSTLWKIAPHTRAKHEILRRYLGAWFGILGSKIPRIMYLDGFCGPGRYQGGEPGSPLIALQEAGKHGIRLKNSELVFFFIDERQDRVDHLRNEINRLSFPSSYRIVIHAGQFQDTLTDVLDELDKRQANLVPTFAFVDPFGFKGVPFDLVARLLANPSTEVFVNIMIDWVNRFVEHPDLHTQRHIVDLFGTPQVLDVIQSDNRLLTLRQLYQEQLQKHAQFVRYFEMRDQRDRIIYYLFFATNHRLGHVKMKESFWKVDSSSGFKFSDKTDPKQMVLFDLDPSENLANDLLSHFSGQVVRSDVVIQFVEDETPYIAKHARGALRILEAKNWIEVEPFKANGQRRRKGTFPNGVVVKFLPK